MSRTKLRKVAVFDIDGTLFRSSLLIEVVEALIEARMFPPRAQALYRREYMRWLNRRGGYDAYIMAVVRSFVRYIRGVKQKDFARIARRVVEFHEDRVYRYTRDLIAHLKKRGYYLLAISHSPKYVVEEFAKKKGFDKIYGYMYAVDSRGKFTGAIRHPEFMADKANVLLRAVEKEGISLTGSVGVGDSESDIPFLRLVERPICFNPNDVLYRAAKRNRWQIVVERKNVVYRVQ